MIEFEWDAANTAHLAAHSVSRADAEQAIRNDPFDIGVQDDDVDGERFQVIGETTAGRILVLIVVWHEDKTRVVTAWDAPRAFKDFYLEERARQTWKSD
jgi:hypothetical protein